jgi:hypothetical protein
MSIFLSEYKLVLIANNSSTCKTGKMLDEDGKLTARSIYDYIVTICFACPESCNIIPKII